MNITNLLQDRRRPAILAGGVAVALALTLWQAVTPASSDTAAAGNGFYRVFVEDKANGDGIGSYTATTGAVHPAGEGRDLLFGGAGDAASSYTTVRSYTTGTDYVQAASGAASGNIVVNMDPYASVSAVGSTGYRVAYSLPGSGRTPDALEITSDINASGSTFADSAVAITTRVANAGPFPVAIGVRYLLDLNVANDDGPAFVAVNPTQPARSTEATYAPPAFAAFRAEDNDAAAPTMTVFGTASADYPGITPATSRPDVLQFAYWPDAYGAAFDYTTSGRDVAGSAGLDDSAVLYYFGASEATAINLNPGQSVTVSVSLFATPPVVAGEVCGNGIDDDGDRLVDGEDGDCAPVGPLAPTPPAGLTPTSLPATGGGPLAPRSGMRLP